MHYHAAGSGGNDSAAAPACECPVDSFPARTDPGGELGLTELERNPCATHLAVIGFTVAFQIDRSLASRQLGVIADRRSQSQG